MGRAWVQPPIFAMCPVSGFYPGFLLWRCEGAGEGGSGLCWEVGSLVGLDFDTTEDGMQNHHEDLAQER